MKNDANLALELVEVVEQRRNLDRREDELKNYFRTRLTGLNLDTVTVGGVLISLTEKCRTSLDRKALEVAFGVDVLTRFEKITPYVQLDVKLVNARSFKKVA